MFNRWRSSSKESKDKSREHDASAMNLVTEPNIPPASFSPVQEFQSYAQLVTELQQRNGPTLEMLQKCCKDNQDKDVKIDMQAKEIQALTDLAATKEIKINELQELLRQSSVTMEAIRSHAQEMEGRAEQLTAELRQLAEEYDAVKEQREKETLEKCKLAEELKKKEKETKEMNDRMISVESSCFSLTEDKEKLLMKVSHLSEDLRASEVHVRFLNKQLKEADGVAQKAAFLLSRVHSLQEEVKENELKHKEADEKYQMQLGISGTLFNEKSELLERSAQLSMNLAQANEAALAAASERDGLQSVVQKQKAEEERLQCQLRERDKKSTELEQMYNAEIRALQEQTMQLIGSLESANAEFSAVVAEKKKLASEAEEQKACEEGLRRLLRDRDKKASDLQQAYDRQCQHLMDVVDFAATRVDPAGQSVGQHARYNLRPRQKTQENAASGVFSMDRSGVWNDSTSHPQNLSVPQLHVPVQNLPVVSTEKLVHYVGRIAVQWYEFGHALGVGDVAANLKQMEQEPTRKCLQCLEAWIERGSQVGCSWDKLLRVLYSLQLYAVAAEIQDELQRMAVSNHSVN